MSLTVITGRHTSLIATNTMSAICPNLLAWLFSNERFAEALASLSGVFPSSSWDSAFIIRGSHVTSPAHIVTKSTKV